MYSVSTPFSISSLKPRVVDSKSPASSSSCSVSSSSGSKLGSCRALMDLGGGDHKPNVVIGEAGYVLEDVPHLSDYIPDLHVRHYFFLLSYCRLNFYLLLLLLLFFLRKKKS